VSSDAQNVTHRQVEIELSKYSRNGLIFFITLVNLGGFFLETFERHKELLSRLYSEY